MSNTRCRLDQLSEINKRNSDRDLEHSEWLFQLNHLPERFEQIKRMIPKPGKEHLFAAIIARYVEELGIA